MISFRSGGLCLLLDELYVREPQRGKGLGRRALEFAEAFARQATCGALRLEVHDVNERAKDLYRRQGILDDRRSVFTKPL